jgi:putative ABC transport system permease protein
MEKNELPPSLLRWILKSFLREELAEEVQGDLEEKYRALLKNKGPFYAKLNYGYQVLHYIRPFALKGKIARNTNRYAMFQNYFKIGWRNLVKNKGYSFINIGGLAVGMMIATLIGLWVYDEVSFDQYHPHYDRLAQVLQHQTFNRVKGTERSIPRPLEMALRTTYGSDFKYVSMSTWTGPQVLMFNDKMVSKTGNYFQPDFPEMLSLRMIRGTRQGLKDPASILLSASTAKALFGDADPMNQSLRIDSRLDVKVTGVYEDLPYNTSFHNLDFMSSWDLFVSSQSWVKDAAHSWGNNSFQLFVQLAPNADVQTVSGKIRTVKAKNSAEEAKFDPEIFLHPMRDWHLRSQWKEGANIGGRIQTVWLFGTIGIFVLLLACINFMNLSTARSEKRAKEVGIRMTVGSVRRQLINQFLSESFLVVTLAFVVALGLVILALPEFNTLADKRITIQWASPLFWIICVGFILVTSLLAGSYPALYLSSFQPVKVLKGSFRLGRFASLPRKVLVVVQFTVSVTLIIGTIIVYRQIQYTKDRPIGYDRSGVIMLAMRSPEFYSRLDILRDELKSRGGAVEVSESSGPITGNWSNNGGFDWKGKDPDLQAEFATVWVTPELGKTIDWQITAGRDFSRDFPSDSTGLLVNETAVKFMGLKEDPIGMEIKWDAAHLHIVGVVKDIIAESPYDPVKQTVYLLSKTNLGWMNLKLNPAKSARESLSLIEAVMKKYVPSMPFEYQFADQEFARKFASEERIGKLASVFAVLAILISCLGLFGLASFVAEQRTKEIGVRKVLGASVTNLWQMLSRDFVILVLIACAIAVPFAYYMLSVWLSGYEYHTGISGWIFVSATVGAMVVTLVTVSYQAIVAAMANPVKSLRSE